MNVHVELARRHREFCACGRSEHLAAQACLPRRTSAKAGGFANVTTQPRYFRAAFYGQLSFAGDDLTLNI